MNRARSLEQISVASAPDAKQVARHSSLTVSVAGWQVYVEELVGEFYDQLSGLNNPSLTRLAIPYRNHADKTLERFNTPNWENAREVLVSLTGYDPISDWTWPRRSLGIQHVRDRLNEILKVRHSFAHGFPLPRYSWTISPSGRLRLTKAAIHEVQAFLSNLVSRTDKGMRRYLVSHFSVHDPW